LEKPHRRLGKATATLDEVRLGGTGANPGPGSRPGVRRARSAARDASL